MSAPVDLPTTRGREVAGHVRALAAALADAGHDVDVHTRRADTATPSESGTTAGVTIRQVDAGPPQPLPESELAAWISDFGRALAEQWRADPPDVVHAYSWTSGLAAAAARQQLRESALVGGGASQPPVPFVLTLAGFGAELRRTREGAPAGRTDAALANRIRLEVALARSVDAVVAGSDDEVEELARMGVPRERITMVPAGIDVDRFAPGPALDASDEARLVALGDLTPSGGFETVIAALRGLPGVELLIFGATADEQQGDDELARLRQGAAQLGVADRVSFADPDLDRTDPGYRPAMLRSADAVVCVPWHGPAGAGRVLEAMACGIPVVVTAVGAVSDVVVDGVSGVLVAPRRPDHLASAIRALLGDPVRRLGFGVAGADRARSRYEWSRVATSVERVYRRLLPTPIVDEEVVLENELPGV
ncbi:glycosyltransferase family 1 protein [Cryptosporangium japonicum]|uniref:Glycosyltransferase family 1 protein n=1 Tax=Cryptosporangium japonicum TaxID=80872 RepID=A0ABP3EZ63_9ACTN